jgi:hypothetical protein
MKKLLYILFFKSLFVFAQTLSLAEQNHSISLEMGWNMIGFTCIEPMNVATALVPIEANVLIVKDNVGNVYLPEFGFNGIESFKFGFGYQIKLIEAISDFSLCNWYVDDITEDNIISLQDSLQLINSQIGCTDSLACNYGLDKIYDDGSCEYPNQGFDCDGVLLPKTLFFFHGGSGGFPYVSDMTAEGATYYYTNEGATTTDLGVAFGAMVTNSPTPYTPENATGQWPIIGSMIFGENETITNSSQQWEYFQTGNNERYYLVVPNNESFPEDMVANALAASSNNIGVQMHSQKDFTWNGDGYTIYKLWPSSSMAGGIFKFLGCP